jgi:DNA-binding PadR family transcriptional regulator
MIQNILTPEELSVLNTIKQQPLTSFEILKKVENISMILSLYTIIDQLKNKGVLKSYVKENTKYHIAC